jgi:hypothetical protein
MVCFQLVSAPRVTGVSAAARVDVAHVFAGSRVRETSAPVA